MIKVLKYIKLIIKDNIIIRLNINNKDNKYDSDNNSESDNNSKSKFIKIIIISIKNLKLLITWQDQLYTIVYNLYNIFNKKNISILFANTRWLKLYLLYSILRVTKDFNFII